MLSTLNGKPVGDITYDYPGICTYTKSYSLVTFTDPSQAGMIYYKETAKLDFSQGKETLTNAASALGKTAIVVGGFVLGALGSLVFN